MDNQARFKTSTHPVPVPPYYKAYVDYVPEDVDLLEQLATSRDRFVDYLAALEEEDWSHRYADGKWSVKEVVIHLMDSERIFATRILRIARGDQTPLPGFSQNDYVPLSLANDRTPASIVEEYLALRNSTISLLQNLPHPAWEFTGSASGQMVSVRGIAFIIAGHELHHLQIMKDRYFPT